MKIRFKLKRPRLKNGRFARIYDFHDKQNTKGFYNRKPKKGARLRYK